MTLSQSDDGLQCHCLWLPSPFSCHATVVLLSASHDIKYMSSRLLSRLLSSSFSVFLYDCFCIGTFAELAPHRWFGLRHILIAMNPWVQLLGCDELHNTCAIQCTNKKIFLIPRMTRETDRWKELHLTEQPDTHVLTLKDMPLLWRMVAYGEQTWESPNYTKAHLFLLLFGSFYFGLVCFLFLAIRAFYEYFGKQ